MTGLPCSMTKEDAASYLGCSVRQVSRLLSSGDLVALPRIGKKIRVTGESIQRVMKEGPVRLHARKMKKGHRKPVPPQSTLDEIRAIAR